MRVVVYGVGAIGGAIAARLALTGSEVVGIARGSMLSAIRDQGGLTLVTTQGTGLVPLEVVAGPDEIDWRADDVVLLTMKANDTDAALVALAAAGVHAQAIVCGQNGVANEFMALRYFPNVVAMVMMMPAQFLVPGTVIASGAPKFGIFDLGGVPSGTGVVPPALVPALEAAGFVCEVRDDAMAGKYGKLLLNLGNIVGAALGAENRFGPWADRVSAEGRTVLRAAGIASYEVAFDNPRRVQMKRTPIPGVDLVGSSSTQSLLRGTGSIETEFLNGEICLIGRQHGVTTPVNTAMVRVARAMVRDGMAPGSFPEAEIERLVAEG